MSEIILEYTRASHVENIHRADVVAVNTKGEIIKQAGNGQLSMFWRSAAKPFQALAFVKNGGLEKYGLNDRELAFLVSSHSGEPFHVELVEGILAKLGLTTDVLNCGAARPMSGKANVEFVLDAKISALIGGDELSGVEVEQGGERRVLPVSGLFVSIGRAPDTEIFSGLISLDKGGYAASGEDCLTVCPGVFVAGDCRAKSVRQLTTAMSDGSVAALAACAWLDK